VAKFHVEGPGKWLLIVRESHLAFASWPADLSELRPLVPAALELDTFDGRPWVTVEMLQCFLVRVRGLPAPPLIAMPQMNVRTYVRCQGERGIYFLSADWPGLFGTATTTTLNRCGPPSNPHRRASRCRGA
jgi:uncharacterized protein YqjF (DUF2071 family)